MMSVDLECEQGGAALAASDCDCVGCAVARARREIPQSYRLAQGEFGGHAAGLGLGPRTKAQAASSAECGCDQGERSACGGARGRGGPHGSGASEGVRGESVGRVTERMNGALGRSDSSATRGRVPTRRSAVARPTKTPSPISDFERAVSRLLRDPRGLAAMLVAGDASPQAFPGPSPAVVPTGGANISPGVVEIVRSMANALTAECAVLPLTVSSCDVALLRNVCSIDLGPDPTMNSVPGRGGRLVASVPLDFEPTSSHNFFLSMMLPRWWNKISDFDEDVWQIATGVFMPSSLPRKEWLNQGLYWQTEDGFLFRAIRYALATLYGWAFTCEEISVFRDGCMIDKDWIRAQMRDEWRVDVDDICSYDLDKIRVEGMGRLALHRTWRGDFIGITPMGASTLNDGVHLNAALADYYFWWAHRLLDFVLAGKSAQPSGDLWVAMCCARAGLAEIVEISGLLMHEISHWAGWPATVYECVGLECCHFQLDWLHKFRVTADCGLPLAMYPDMAEDEHVDPAGGDWHHIDYYDRQKSTFPVDSTGTVRERFDFSYTDTWSFTYSFAADYDCGRDGGSSMTGVHSHWSDYDHGLKVTWNYPQECAEGSSSGSRTFND